LISVHLTGSITLTLPPKKLRTNTGAAALTCATSITRHAPIPAISLQNTLKRITSSLQKTARNAIPDQTE
jgi:hypothetical protein